MRSLPLYWPSQATGSAYDPWEGLEEGTEEVKRGLIPSIQARAQHAVDKAKESIRFFVLRLQLGTKKQNEKIKFKARERDVPMVLCECNRATAP